MKKNILALLMSACCLAASLPSIPAFADGQKVVTLGADLSEDQKQAILRYFGVAGQSIQTLTITNQDERNHLGAYVPLEQIGTRTYSCALVNPTTSGGIQVKTANLSWVTSNMIASTLSTSGVVNCDVLAAAPFEVSGTGALTGILMAYESAAGEQLSEEKKEIATQELITTTTIANSLGQQQATEIVTDAKIQVIQGNVTNATDIDVIINEVAEEKEIALTQEDRELLNSLLQEISAQDYEYEEMKDTLERVEANVNTYIENASVISTDSSDTLSTEAPAASEATPQTEAPAAVDGTLPETPETLASDSILMNTDDSALGNGVIFDATDTSALAETEAPAAPTEGGDLLITSTDTYIETEPAVEIPQTEPAGDVIETVPTEPAGDVIETIPTEAPVDVIETIPTEATVDVVETIPTEEEVIATEAVETEPETAEPVTTNLEILPLSDFLFAPVTSDATGYTIYPAGIDELTVSFQNGAIIGGSGTLSLYNAADSSLVETIYMNDSSKVEIRPLDGEELSEYGWGSGYKAVISLSNYLEQNKTYFVALSQDAFATADGIGTSEATPDSYSWVIQTSGFGFALDRPQGGVTAGSTVSGTVLMAGSGASYAVIENADDSVSFDQEEFWDNGSVNVTFGQPGKAGFYISFYDEADGNLLESFEYVTDVR